MSALGSVQPHVRPCSATISSGTRKTTRPSAPGQSILCRLLRTGRCRFFTTTASAMAPSGTLTQKIQRHPVSPRMESWPARKPPMTGPSTEEVPKTAMK